MGAFNGASRLIPTRSLLALLLAVNILLTGIYLGQTFRGGTSWQFLDLNREGNFPSWWSSNQLLVAGLLLLLVAFRNVWRSKAAWTLGMLGFLLVAMSLDEMTALHERVGFIADRVLVARQDTAFGRSGLWFAFIGVPFAVLLVAIMMGISKFLMSVPGSLLRIAIGFAILLSGAVGMEIVGNWVRDDQYFLMVAAEEFLEMTGGSIILWASFVFACRHPSTVQFGSVMTPLAAERPHALPLAGYPENAV